MNNNINQTIQNLMQLKNMGRNPQAIMQMLMQRNPNYQQAITRVQNMSQGKTPQEFITQLAKQQGVSEQNLQNLMNMLK